MASTAYCFPPKPDAISFGEVSYAEQIARFAVGYSCAKYLEKIVRQVAVAQHFHFVLFIAKAPLQACL